MKAYLFPVLLLLSIIACRSVRSASAVAPAPLAFPADFVGNWRGELDVFVPGRGPVQTVAMELQIAPLTDTSYTWVIIYGEDKEAGRRPYELLVRDAARGHYTIDEQNGIALDAYLLGEVFVQRFDVMGNLLETQIRLQPDGTLRWEIFSGPLQTSYTSGDRVVGGDTIPPVGSYGLGNYQRAILTRH